MGGRRGWQGVGGEGLRVGGGPELSDVVEAGCGMAGWAV